MGVGGVSPIERLTQWEEVSCVCVPVLLPEEVSRVPSPEGRPRWNGSPAPERKGLRTLQAPWGESPWGSSPVADGTESSSGWQTSGKRVVSKPRPPPDSTSACQGRGPRRTGQDTPYSFPEAPAETTGRVTVTGGDRGGDARRPSRGGGSLRRGGTPTRPRWVGGEPSRPTSRPGGRRFLRPHGRGVRGPRDSLLPSYRESPRTFGWVSGVPDPSSVPPGRLLTLETQLFESPESRPGQLRKR